MNDKKYYIQVLEEGGFLYQNTIQYYYPIKDDGTIEPLQSTRIDKLTNRNVIITNKQSGYGYGWDGFTGCKQNNKSCGELCGLNINELYQCISCGGQFPEWEDACMEGGERICQICWDDDSVCDNSPVNEK